MAINDEHLLNQHGRNGFFIGLDDGVQTFVEVYLPSGLIQCQILCLPGIGNYGWYFEPLASFLNQCGVAVYAVDYRGTGLSTGDRWDIPSPTRWIDDIVSTIHNLVKPGVPMFLLGHSLGGALAAHVAALVERQLKGVIVVAPAMTVEQDRLPSVNYLLFPFGLLFARKHPLLHIPYPSMEDMINRKHADRQLAEGLLKEPYVLRKLSIRGGMVLNHIRKLDNVIDSARRTEIPALVLCGEDDTALRGTVDYFESIASEKKQLITYPSQHHHLLRHSDTDVFDDIVGWMRKLGVRLGFSTNGHTGE